MRFVSTAEQTIRCTEEMVVLCYEEERILLPLPPTFSEAQRVARDTFGIETDSDLVFETTDLLGCADVGPVRIHEAAWAGIVPVLPKVFVRAFHRNGEPEATAVAQSRHSIAKAPAPRVSHLFDTNVDPIPSGPSASRMSVTGRDSLRKSLASVFETALQDTASSSTDTVHNARTTGTVPATSNSSAARTSNSTSRVPRAPSFVPPKRTSIPSSSSSSSRRQTKVTEEDEDAYVPAPSPSKGKRAHRKLVLSEDEQDDADAEYDRVGTEEARSAEDEEDEEAVEQEMSVAPLSEDGARPEAESAGEDEKVSALAERTERLSLARSQRTSMPKPVEPPEPELETPDLQTLIAPLENVEKTFLVTVEYDDGEGEEPHASTFKTKGRHTVHKVLHTVCKTFGLDDYYSVAQLVLVIDEEIDGGRIVEHRFVCANEDTMANAGARPDSRFELVIDTEE